MFNEERHGSPKWHLNPERLIFPDDPGENSSDKQPPPGGWPCGGGVGGGGGRDGGTDKAKENDKVTAARVALRNAQEEAKDKVIAANAETKKAQE